MRFLRSHIERGPLEMFEISAFLIVLAGARRAQRRGVEMGTPTAERYTPSGAASAKEKGAL
jgi:hypothetical protein